MIALDIIGIFYLFCFQVVLLSETEKGSTCSKTPQQSELKKYVISQLMEKYRIAKGLSSVPSFIGWNQVDITGWPEGVNCFYSFSWNESAVQALFDSLNEIKMTPKVKVEPSASNHRVTVRETSSSMYKKFVEFLQPFGCISGERILWNNVFHLFPDLRLTTTSSVKWTRSDIDEIQKVLSSRPVLKVQPCIKSSADKITSKRPISDLLPDTDSSAKRTSITVQSSEATKSVTVDSSSTLEPITSNPLCLSPVQKQPEIVHKAKRLLILTETELLPKVIFDDA